MQIFSSITEDVWHDLKGAGAYEWWYFDALDHSGRYSFVAIWYSGFPFSPYYLRRTALWKKSSAGRPAHARAAAPSPLEHTAFSFNLYIDGEEFINFIKEGDAHLFESSRTEPCARFERNAFRYDALQNRYVLCVDFSMPSRRKKVVGELYFDVRPIARLNDVSALSAGEGFHRWVLAAPSSGVSGTLDLVDGGKREQIHFTGKGYHDHNYGSVPMHTDIQHWYWGRAHTSPHEPVPTGASKPHPQRPHLPEQLSGHAPELDVVYYHIAYKDAARKPFTFLLVTESESIIAQENRLVARIDDQRRALMSPMLSLQYGKRLALFGDEASGIRFEVDHQKKLDTGPFYLRFQSACELRLPSHQPLTLTGISEFLHPEKINSGVVQNLIKSKVWREGQRSTMYTLYNFFNRLFD